ncbi:MAG: DNA polymerase [Nitrososphaeria archaeon]
MKAHYIKSNKSLRLPTAIVFYDTETKHEKINDLKIHKLKLGVARYVKLEKSNVVSSKYYIFKDKSRFFDILESHLRNKNRLWVVSHNQHFDFNLLDGFKELLSRQFRITKMVLESDVFIIKAVKALSSLVFVDSTNYFKAPLNELGKQINLQKLEIDFENCSEEQLITYCVRDVEILSEYFIKFLRWWSTNNLGNFAFSAAGLAFNAFKHRFMTHKIFVHDNENAIKLELESYRGGRNECFRLGEINEKLYKLDVNSMYPSVMRFNEYPVKFVKFTRNVTVDKLKELIKKYHVIAKVKLNTEENAYAYKMHKLIFPIGTFIVTLTTPEISYALKNDHILDIYECAFYNKAYIFKDYVDFFYKMKLEAEKSGNKVVRAFAKLLMNSLYGKFAQKVRELSELPMPPILDFGTTLYLDSTKGERFKIYFVNGKAYKLEKQEKLFYDANVAIASHVTAYARMYLYELMKTAGLENVYYTDTDSLIVNETGYNRLKHLVGNELGMLKLEKEADKAIFFTVKDYIFGDEVKTKGVKPASLKISENMYLNEQWLRTKSLLTMGYHGTVITKDVIKILNRIYDKGVVHNDLHIKPFRLTL